MANIGDIYIGGKNAGRILHPNVVNGAVGFTLNQAASIDCTYSSDDMNWDVEIKTGHRSIVARSKGVLLRDDILKIGFEQVQRALDVFAFESSLLLAVSNPGDSHTLFFLVMVN